MGYARILCVGLVGMAGHLVEVEADLSAGLPAVVLTGLPDAALHESRDRVRAAVVNSGQAWPSRRITVNLRPATLPKYGSGYDLAVAAALLAGAGDLPVTRLDGVAILGGFEDKLFDAGSAGRDAPIVRVTGVAIMGGVAAQVQAVGAED